MEMSSIQTGIELNDQFSSVLNHIVSSVNLAVSAMYDMQQGMNTNIDTSSIEGARDEINQATMAANELLQAMSGLGSQNSLPNVPAEPVEVPVHSEIDNVPVEAVEVPVHWEMDNLQVFADTGIERFQREVQSTNSMLEQLSSTQDEIARQAYNTNLFPPEAFRNLNSLAVRIDTVRDRIQQIEDNRINFGTDMANTELEQLRSQLNQAVQEQNELNEAMQNMDVSAANDAYLQLSRTIGNTERYIRDNIDEQGRFNQQIRDGTQQADNLTRMIKNAVTAYVSIQSIGNVLNISDEFMMTKSRLDMMNDGLQTADGLVNMVYASAQNARGSFSDMADVVARFGNNAKDAFGSSREVVEFAELVQKQMTIAGASTQEASNAMLQLSQALGSGVLRGDELNSIFEQSPNLIRGIADYIEQNDALLNSFAGRLKMESDDLRGNVMGHIRDIASEGMLSAEIVKASVFSASDEINAKFEEMPMTWGQVWQSIQNTALMKFQPVLERLNEMANSESFQTFVNNAVEAMALLADTVLNIFDLVASAGSFISDNWAVIGPIIYGVVAALAVYAAYLGIVKGIELASAAGKGLLAAATMIATGATWAQTTAQMGLNGAMYACPIVWIIMLIIALIAVIFAACNAIADMTGAATTGFGMICGGVNVVIQFFKNLGLFIANIALGIGNAIAALGSNIMTAFHNAICSVQSWWYSLLSTVLNVVAGICEALNKLPFVEFDYSGITSAADDYAAKSAAAAGSKEDYTSISDAFNAGINTFDTFQDGWVSDAYDAGASWGDGVIGSLDGLFGGGSGLGDAAQAGANVGSSITGGFGGGAISAIEDTGVDSNLGSIAGDTGAIKDSMDITQEELKYLRDIAEQEAVNRYTVAEIHIDQSGMQNNINSGDDIDGFMTKLTDSVNEAVDSMTEGVHT